MISAEEANRMTESVLHPGIELQLDELQRKLDAEIEIGIRQGVYHARLHIPSDLLCSPVIPRSLSKFVENVRDHGYVVRWGSGCIDVYWS